jgi:hypothetical protein
VGNDDEEEEKARASVGRDEFAEEWYNATHPNVIEYEHGRMEIRSLICCFTGGFGITRRGANTREVVSYRYFLDTARTGDILLFEGNGAFSFVIQCFSQLRYSHVGMVVRLLDEETGKEHLFIWESTTKDQTHDFLTGRDKNGPRLVSAHEKLLEYAVNNYTISYRPMRIDDPRIVADIEDGVTDLYMWATFFLMSKLPYETDIFELSNAHLRMITGVTEDREMGNRFAMFCSELVGYTLRNGMGFSFFDYRDNRAMAPEDFSPEDFTEEAQGIPFAMDFYRDNGGILVRPAQALYGGQYIVATNSRIDAMLRRKYEEFTGPRRGEPLRSKKALEQMFKDSIPEIATALLNYKEELVGRKRDGTGGMQEVPLTRLRFVYRTRTLPKSRT